MDASLVRGLNNKLTKTCSQLKSFPLSQIQFIIAKVLKILPKLTIDFRMT